MECPVCFASNNGAYIFTECGHSTCPQCIIRMHEISQHLRCPMCRVTINSAPVIVQAFASHMPDGLVHTMRQNFERWFQTPTNVLGNITNIHNINHITNTDTHIHANTQATSQANTQITQHLSSENLLIHAAAQEWDIITTGEDFNTSNSITSLILLNRGHNLPNNWTFTEFTEMYTLNTSYTLNRQIEFAERWSPNQRKRFRRVIIYLDDNRITDKIRSLEQHVFSMCNTLVPFSEIGMRNNRNSICAYSLSNDTHEPATNISTNITLICRGAWTHDGRVGCRWFVNGLYN